MAFSSQIFLFLLLPITLLCFFICPAKARRYLIILISLAFLAWNSFSGLLIFLLFTAMNFLLGLWIQKSKTATPNHEGKSLYVWVAVIANLAFLLAFRFPQVFSFLPEPLSLITDKIIRTLGVSFLVFNALSYHFDIANDTIHAEKNPLKFLLYMAYFPKIIQGPLMRYSDFSAQSFATQIDVAAISNGIFRFTIGLAKKIILADQLGSLLVDKVFVPGQNIPIWMAWLGIIGYALQIYFDFSGYSDMAVGLSSIFGIKLPENFNRPYTALSISDFWRRWHISLSNWFRDYVFYPLEYKRRKQKTLRSESNTLIVFFLTGLWHGISWNFLIWGLWHGLFSSLEAFLRNKKVKFKAPAAIRYLTTMLIILIAWVFFRSESLVTAWDYLKNMFGVLPVTQNLPVLHLYGLNKICTLVVVACIACLPLEQYFPKLRQKLSESKSADFLRFLVFASLLFFSIMVLMSSSYQAFIYFRF